MSETGMEEEWACLLSYWAQRVGYIRKGLDLEVLRLYTSLLSGNQCECAVKM